MNVLVTGTIHREGLRRLRKHHDVTQHKPNDEEELIELLQDKDAVVNLASTAITEEVMERSPRLRISSNHCVGTDNVDIQAATERHIAVTNTPVSAETVADHAFALLLAVAKRVVDGDSYIRTEEYTRNEPMQMLGWDVHDTTLGILGLGRIGKAVARRAKGFGMNILYHDQERFKRFEKQHTVKYRTKDMLLKRSDQIITTLPHTEATEHFIGVTEFNTMQDHCIFINVGRGPVVDEDALIHALKHDVIRGAGLDVFEHEPDVPHDLLDRENVVVTPHIASDTVENRERMATTAAENALAVLNGEEPEYLVNDVTIGPGYAKPFFLHNGDVIVDTTVLRNALERCSDATYQHHVSEGNDFAAWVRDVLQQERMARELTEAKSRQEAIQVLDGE